MTTVAPYLRRRSLENSHWYMGHLATCLATGSDTGGTLSVFEMNVRPGLEPPAHVHSREEEAIFVLDGHLTGRVGAEPVASGPGELLRLPGGVPHGWKVAPGIDGQSLHGLLILTPSGLERYFLDHAEPAAALTLPPIHDEAYRTRLEQRAGAAFAGACAYGVTWLAPGDEPAASPVAPAEPMALNVLGETFVPLAVAAQTGGAYTATLWTSPAQSQLPRHRHTVADEAFYVLEGEVLVTAGDDFAVIAGPGDFVFLPKGIPHSHRAAGGQPSRALQIQTPGGVEAALAEVAAMAPEAITLEWLMDCARRGGIELLPEA